MFKSINDIAIEKVAIMGLVIVLLVLISAVLFYNYREQWKEVELYRMGCDKIARDSWDCPSPERKLNNPEAELDRNR